MRKFGGSALLALGLWGVAHFGLLSKPAVSDAGPVPKVDAVATLVVPL